MDRAAQCVCVYSALLITPTLPYYNRTFAPRWRRGGLRGLNDIWQQRDRPRRLKRRRGASQGTCRRDHPNIHWGEERALPPLGVVRCTFVHAQVEGVLGMEKVWGRREREGDGCLVSLQRDHARRMPPPRERGLPFRLPVRHASWNLGD